MKIQLNALVLAVSASLLLSACGKNTSESVDRPTVKDSSQPTQPEKQPETKPEKKPETKPEKQPEETKPATGEKALSDVLKEGRFSKFSGALANVPGEKNPTLTQQIESMEAVTVLAPTDEAIEKTVAILEKLKLLKDTDGNSKVDAFDLFKNQELLTSVLKYHVLTQNLDATTLMKKVNTNLPTLNGLPLVVTKEGDNYVIPSQAIQLANIAKAGTAPQAQISTKDGKPEVNIKIKNGVVHVIDQALIPPTLTAEEALAKIPEAASFNAVAKVAMGEDKKSLSDFATTKSETGYTYLIPDNNGVKVKCKAAQEKYGSFLSGQSLVKEDGSCNEEVLKIPLVTGYLPQLFIQPNLKDGTKFSAQVGGMKGEIKIANIVATNGAIHIVSQSQ